LAGSKLEYKHPRQEYSMGKAVAGTKKITIEVEVPEGVDEESMERLWRAFIAWISMKRVREILSDEELAGVFRQVEERVWMKHKQSSST
jgi:hypothetical protein